VKRIYALLTAVKKHRTKEKRKKNNTSINTSDEVIVGKIITNLFRHRFFLSTKKILISGINTFYALFLVKKMKI
jgi:hypothetical protein